MQQQLLLLQYNGFAIDFDYNAVRLHLLLIAKRGQNENGIVIECVTSNDTMVLTIKMYKI